MWTNSAISNRRGRWGSVTLGLALLAAVALWYARREPHHDGKPLSYWMAALRSGHSEDRGNALHAIRRLGAESLPLLVDWLTAREPHSKIAMLEWVESKPALEAIFSKLNLRSASNWRAEMDERRWAALQAFEALGPSAAPAIPSLLAVLPNTQQTELIFEPLKHLGSTVVEPLTAKLSDTRPSVRANAGRALASLIDVDRSMAVPGLLRCIEEADETVSTTAIAALGEMHSQPAKVIPALAQKLRDPSPSVQIAAAEALSRFGADAGPAALDLLDLLDATDADTRSAATEALSKIGAEASTVVPVLLRKLEHDSVQTRASCAFALGHFKSESNRVLPALLACLRDPNQRVRRAAASGLVILRADLATVVPELIAQLEAEDAATRAQTALCLGSLGADAKDAIPALQSLLAKTARSAGERYGNSFGISVDIGATTKLALAAIEGSAFIPKTSLSALLTIDKRAP